MDKFQSEVLNSLIDKYNRSVLSKGGSERNLKIQIRTGDMALKSYTGREAFKFIEENDKKLKSLQDKNYILVHRDRNGQLDNVELNISSIKFICNDLQREVKTEKLNSILRVLEANDYHDFIKAFVDSESNYIRNKYDWHSSYYFDENELIEILTVLNKLLELQEEQMEREFSANILHDSKRFSAIRKKVVAIIKKYGYEHLSTDENNDDDYEILKCFNLVKNSTYALVKGNLCFSLNNQIIDLNVLNFEFSLSDQMIKQIKITSTNIEKVFTVENLTSFYKINEADSIIIFLAGFHNHTKQMLIKKIAYNCNIKEFYHFGDIDAGGFQIFFNLIKDTGLPFLPYKMSINELKNNSGKLKKLTERDRNRLIKMSSDENFACFFEVIKYMLKNNVKLEQEILD